MPELNGAAPIKVEVTGTNVTYTYDEETRKLTAQKEAVVDENGIITFQAYDGIYSNYRYNKFNIKVTYPLEAYYKGGAETLEYTSIVNAYYEGFNNPGSDFKNPYKSNTVKGIFILNIRTGGGDVGFDIYVGKRLYKPTDRYMVSKEKTLKIYNEISEEEKNDTYLVRWIGYTGANDTTGIIMKESNGEEVVSDQLVKNDGTSISLENATTNIGIYFLNPVNILGEEGWIKVYDDETDELLVTFTKDNWNKYNSNIPYKYNTPVKHIRIETSSTNKNSSLDIYNVKELDDEYITSNISKEEFDNIVGIRSTISGYLSGNYINLDVHVANYEAPYSRAEIELSKDALSTQETENNMQIIIKAQADENINQVKWQNASFLLKLPQDIIDLELNSVTSNNRNVVLTSYEQYEEDGIKYIKINTQNDTATVFNVTVDCNITPDPRIATQTETLELYSFNENAVEYWNKAQDIYDVNDNLNTNELVGKEARNISLVSPSSLLISQTVSNYDRSGSISIAPQVASVDKSQRTADINIEIKNNYSNTISEVKILGRVPFEGNKYTINGNEMGSTFTTTMKDTGITVPEDLKDVVTVYYSENGEATRDLTDVNNNWKVASEVTDWSQVKSYLIDLENYVLAVEEERQFSYTIDIPEGLEYNQVSYSHNGIYFTLDTAEGKYRTQIEPNKVGLMISKQYDLSLTKYQTGKEKLVSGATYSITEEGQEESKTRLTGINGNFVLKNLYLDRTYIVREIKSPVEYELNGNEIKFSTYEENGELKVRLLSEKNTVKSIEVIKPQDDQGYKVQIEVEDEAKANLKIVKVEKGTENRIKTVRFKLTGEGLSEKGRTLTTNDIGEASLKGLKIGAEYTLEEVKADSYYLASPIKFTINNNDGSYSVNVVEESNVVKTSEVTEEDSIPTINLKIENEKIPTYNLQINKVIKGETTETGENVPLSGAKFRLLKGTEKIEDFITDENGLITINNLYQYETEKNIDQTYTLKEILAPDGYSAVKDITFKVENIEGLLTMDVLEGRIKEQTASGDTISVTIEDSPSFKLIKVDGESEEVVVLPNTKFAIYSVDDGKEQIALDNKFNILGTKETINGRDYYVLTTNENGEITANLREGLYKAVEIKASDEKYDITNNVYYFGIGASREGVEKIVPTFATSVGGSGNDQITSVAETTDGGIVAGGYFTSDTIQIGNYTFTNKSGVGNAIGILIKYSENGEIDWATSLDELADSPIYSVIGTQDGGIVIGGRFIGTIQVGEYTLTSYGYDGMLIKYNVEGKVEWATKVGANLRDEIKSISETNNGDILVGGFFQGTIQVGEYTITGQYSNNGIIIKYDVGGEVKWATKVGENCSNIIFSVSETKDGGIVAGGQYYNGTIQLGDYSFTTTHWDGMVIKYDTEGKIEWATSIGTGDYPEDVINSVIGTQDGGVVAVGYFNKTIQVGDYTLTSNNTYNGIIIKYNSTGKVEWAKSIGSDRPNESIESVTETADGGILIGGNFENSFQLEDFPISNRGGSDGVLIKYDTNGEIKWTTSVGGSSNDYIKTVIEKNDGTIVAGGYFSVSVQAGDYILNSNGTQDGMIVKYGPKELADPKITSIISLNISNNNDRNGIKSLSKTTDGGMIAAGFFEGTIQVGNNTLTSFNNKNNNHYPDGIVIKYSSNGEVEWVNQIGVAGFDAIESVVETQDKGILVGGYFQGTIQVGDYTLTSQGYSGLVIKYNSIGEVEWATKIAANTSSQIYSVSETSDGGIIVGGRYKGTIQVGDHILTSVGKSTYGDGIIIKYNNSYEVEWVNSIMFNAASSKINSVVGTQDGGIAVGLRFQETFPENFPVGDYTGSVVSGLLVKYNAKGEVEWATACDTFVNSIVENQDREIIVGAQISIGPIIIKYDSKGKEKWKFESKGTYITSVSETKDGGIIVGGYSDKTIEAGNYTLTNKGNNDGIVIKYDRDGKVEWATSVGTETDDYINSVTEKEDGTIVAGGYVKSNNVQDGTLWSIVNYKGVPEVEQIVAKNNRKEFKIITDVKEIDGIKGGTISGDGSSNYEKVKYGDNSTKAIVMTPEENYEIIGITVNDEEYPFTANEDGSYTMPAFENMQEDKHIEVTYSLQDRKITLNKIDSKTKEPLSGVKFKLDQIEERTAPESVIGELTDNGEYHFVKNEDGKYIPTNSKTYQEENGGTEGIQDVTANSYIPIDLSSYTGKYNLTLEAKVSSQAGNDIGYAAVTTTETAPAYNNGTGRFVYISGTVAETDYTTVLQGGQMYYLHLGYRKNADTDTGEDIFTVNNVRVTLNDSEIYHVEIETNSEGKAVTQIPFGKYTLTEINTPEGYQPLKEPVIIEFREDGNKVVENPNYANITVEETTGEFVVENIAKSKVIVHHYLKDNEGNYTENKVAEDDILEGLLDENYVSIPHLDLDKYELEKDENGEFVVPEKATGTFAEEVIEVIYYYETKNIPLTVHHYIEGTTNPVILSDGSEAQDENYTGKEGQSYTTNALTSEELNVKYYLITEPENKEGTYQDDEIIVVYYYKAREMKLTTKAEPHEEINEQGEVVQVIGGTISGQNEQAYETVEYGEDSTKDIIITPEENYKVSKITVNGEEIEFTPDENGIVVLDKFIEVTENKEVAITFEKIVGQVTVHHYIEGTTEKVLLLDGTEAEDEIKTGYVGSIYATKEREDISLGYEFVSATESASGTYIDGNIEVIYYYQKRADLSYTVKYLEKDGDDDNSNNNVLHDEKIVENQVFESEVTEEAIEIEGYDKVEPATTTIDIDVSGNEIVFYYTKRTDLSYTVKYLEKDGDDDNSNNNVLHDEKVVSGQTFKSTATEQAIDIKGYNKVEPIEKSITIKVSGNEIIFYYTKRIDLSYTVQYLDEDTDEEIASPKVVDNQVFADRITENAIDIDGYNKVDPTEQTIAIDVENNLIKFYYTKRTDLSYTVKYLEQVTNTELATAKTVNGQTFKSSVTESAIDIEGYNKVEPISNTITIGVSGNEITFYYTKRTDLSYTVKYLEKDTEKQLAEPKVVGNKTFKETVTESAIDIDGYNKVDETEKSIEIQVSGNEIVFYYIKRTDLSYTVKYFEKGTSNELSLAKVVPNQTFEAVIDSNSEVISIDGFKFDSCDKDSLTITTNLDANVINIYYTRVTGLSYTVNYLEKGTNEVINPQKVDGEQTFGNKIIASNEVIEIDGYNYDSRDKEEITITTGENVLNLYYTKRTDLSYTVKYLEKDTDDDNTNNQVLHEEKVVHNKTFKEEITENAIDIEGYDKVGEIEKTITIKTSGNEIIFYYAKRTDLSYTVKYLEQGTNNKLSEEKVVNNQVFESEITENAIDIEGYNKVEPISSTITIGVSGNEITFYYCKRTDLSYIVKYLELDGDEDDTNNRVLHEAKVVENQVFGTEIIEEAIDIEGFNKVDPIEGKITIGVNTNEITFYYTKRTNLSYTVKYLEQDTEIKLHEEKVVTDQVFEAEVTESAIDIEGYDKVAPTDAKLTIKVSGNEIVFYYTKRSDLSYTVKYLEKDNDSDDSNNNVLHEEKIVSGQVFEAEVTESAIDIEGYDKVAPTDVKITIAVSGNEITFYYTKRTDLSYTVKYLEQDTNEKLADEKVVENQVFKSTVTEQAIDIKGYNQVEPIEKSTTIKVSGNEIIFYYIKRTDLSYTVQYLDEDTEEEIAEVKTVENQTYMSRVKEEAIDIEGYNKVAPTEQTIAIDVEGNLIKFYYTKRTDLSYTVKYLEQDTNAELHTPKTVTGQTFKVEVTENAIDIEGYNKVEPSQEIITIAVSGNEITFYYTKRTDLSYTVKYLEQDTKKTLAPNKVVSNQVFESIVTENAIDIEGYDKVAPTEQSTTIKVSGNEIIFYYCKRTNLSYTVKYLEKDSNIELATEKVVNNQVFESEVTESAIDIEGYDKVAPTDATIKIAVSGNEITFYYTKRTDLSYTVKYLEQDTNEKLADEKVVTNQVFESTVTEQAIDIKGYDKVNPTEKSITIKVSGNEIIFYYTKRVDLSYTVQYLDEDTEEEIATSKTVENQTYMSRVKEEAIDIEGYNKVAPTEQTIAIDVEGNLIKFYYTKRTDLSYTVKYLEQDTEIELHEEKVVNGQKFKSTVTEKPIDIDGYNKVDEAEKSIEIAVSGNEITFYYVKRNDLSYTVNYLEKDSNKVLATQKVTNEQIFGTVINAKDEVIEINGYNFDSTDKEEITISTKENIINVYYTKVTGLSYKVNYLDKETGEVISPAKVQGEQVFENVIKATDEVIEIEGYNFDSSDKNEITITTGENVLNLYYTKRTDLSYVVHYLEKDTNKKLAEDKNVSGRTFKEEVTESAIDIEGYDKVAPTDEKITIEVSGNEITFYYTKRADLSYTVKYLEQGTNTELVPAKTVEDQVFESEVKEEAINIEGYDKVDPTQSTIKIAVSGNEIIFYYTKRTDLSYTVKYLEQDTNKELALAKTVGDQVFESTVTESAIDIEGYDKVDETEKSIEIAVSGNEIIFYYTKRVDLSYTVRYLEQDTNTELALAKTVGNQVFESTVTENAIEIEGYNKVAPTEKSIVIEVEGNEIIFYYTKRSDLTYTVKYLEQDTNAKLADEKIVDSQVFESEVTESAIEIEGYDKVDPIEKSIKIAVSGNEIIFYYTKRVDLSYMVKYLEQDTNKELATAKTVSDQVFKNTVTESAIEIEGYNKVAPTEKSIVIEVEENEIVFYYCKRTDLSYTVRYLEQDTNTELAPVKTVGNQVFESEVKEETIDIEGYDKVDPTETTIKIAVSGNEIIFYYTKRADLSYTVKYLEKDIDEDDSNNRVLHEEKVVDGQVFESTVTESAIDIEGFNKIAPTEKTIVIEVEGNEITFYYTKKSDLTYTVNYLEQDTNTVLAPAKTVENQVFESEITEDAIDIEGYDKVDPTSQTIVIEVEGNEITFYYTKRTDLSYTVKYLEQDTNEKVAEDKVENGRTFRETITEFAIDVEGYNKVDPTEKSIVIAVEGNEIIFYYTKRADLSYTVKYLDEDTEEEIAQAKVVGNQVLKTEITETAIDIEGYNKVDPTSQTIVIAVEGNEIKFYYTKRTDLIYTVKYLEQDTNLEVAESKTVGDKTLKETVTESAIDVDGYNKVDPTEKSIEISVSGNEIIFYYTKKADLSYTVKYLEKDTNTELAPAKVVENQVFESTVIENAIAIDGYNPEDSTEKSIVIATSGNEITFYYTKRNDLSYTVNYLEKDTNIVLKESKTVEGQRFGDIIDTAEEKVAISGYDFDSIDKEQLTITTNLEANIINILYTKGKFNYTVEYYYDNEIDNSKTSTTSATFQDVIATYEDKNIPGYKLQDVEGLPLTVTEFPVMNVIKVYYVKDIFEYSVNYYYNEVLKAEKTEHSEGVFGTTIDTYKDKQDYGYELDRVENLPLTISKEPTQNIINVYYTRKDAQVVVKYVDKATGEEISEETIKEGKVFDNFDVMEDQKDIEGYNLIETPKDATGRYEEEPQERTFYYAKNTRVIVKYLEKESDLPVANEIIIEGYEGKDYTTVEQNVENYVCVDNSGELNGKMPREESTVIYYYLQNTKVVVNHIDQISGTVLASEEQAGLVGDEYTSSAKDFEGYVLVEKPENEVVTMAKDVITINYYYKKVSAGVIEKHIDIKTNELLDSTLYEGNEGDPYTTEEKSFYGYDIVADQMPENAEGEMTVEVIEVRYYYIRKASVKVEYIDKATNKTINETYQLEERDSTEYIRGYEGDPYKTVEKQFTGYDIVPELYPANAEGVMQVVKDKNGNIVVDDSGNAVTETVVRYYYAYKTEVKERHLDVKTGDLLDEVTYPGHEGEDYSTSSKEIQGYDLVEAKLPINAKGKMTVDTITVDYYYIKNMTVKVEYIDVITNETLTEKVQVPGRPGVYTDKDSTEIIKGHEGDEYKTTEKVFENYTIVKDKYPTNWQGVMEMTIGEDGRLSTEIVVRYYYVHVSAGVVEKHIDAITGKELETETRYQGNEGDQYKTNSKEFKGYDLVTNRLPENAEGKMTKEETVVKYYYIRKVTVTIQYLEENTNNKLEPDKVIEGHESERYYAEGKNIAGYEFVRVSGDKEGVLGKEDIVVKYYYKKIQAQTPNNNANTTSKPNNTTNTTPTQNKPKAPIPYGKDLPDTGDIVPFVTGGVILLVAAANAMISIVNKKRKNN